MVSSAGPDRAASRSSMALAAAAISSVRVGALGLEIGLGRGERRGQLVLGPVDVAAQLVLERREGLTGLAATALGLVLEGGQGALARVLIDVGDDVQGEVQDALEVARADVEQDAEPARACP